MKLRNIFLASLAVCTMASCSKDDDINKGPAQPVDAQVSFGITTDAMTKAGGIEQNDTQTGTDNENFVETLTALIFDTNGKLVGRKDTVQPDENKHLSIDKIEHVTIKVTPDDGNEGRSNENFQAVLIANAKDEVAKVTQLSDLDNGTAALELKNYSDVSNGPVRLPMASRTLQFSGVKPLGDDHTENWIYNDGSGIKVTDNLVKPQSMVITLYRLVARIDLEKVTVPPESGINFVLTRIFLANVAAKSPVKYLTSDKNTLVETPNAVDNLWKGFQSAAFEVSKNLIIPGTRTGVIEEDAVVKPFLGKNWGSKFTLAQMNSSLDFANKNVDEPVPQFYIFAKPHAEDNKYHTRLVLEGIFKRTQNSPEELRHFHVVLNKKGQNGVENGVMANYIYKLTVTITGEGSPNEDEILLNAHISATIDVAPWNVIEQNENDTN